MDEPFELRPDSRLLVRVLRKHDDERADWLRLSAQRLEHAYSEDEPEFGLDTIKNTSG